MAPGASLPWFMPALRPPGEGRLAASSAQARIGTARLTAAALGLVLGLSSAAASPLLLLWQPGAVLALLTLSLSLLPFLGLSVAWRVRESTARARLLAAPALAVAALCSLSLLLLWGVYRGQLRVLNLGEEPFVLWIDGKRLMRVEPSSGESPLAGVELTVPAGWRELRAISVLDGRELFHGRGLVHGGRPHLFVPIRAGYCFSIERRGYGSAPDEPLQSEPLDPERSLWALPEGIAWFTPNPEPGPLHTSGGMLASLRQKRCR